jgi:hypothetical protein
MPKGSKMEGHPLFKARTFAYSSRLRMDYFIPENGLFYGMTAISEIWKNRSDIPPTTSHIIRCADYTIGQEKQEERYCVEEYFGAEPSV